MNIKYVAKAKKKILLYVVITYITLSFVYLLIAVVLQIKANQLKKNEIIKNEERLMNVEQNVLLSRIDRVISDTLYISDSLVLHSLDNDDFKSVENEWKAFSDRRKIYDQIRYIDLEGNEKIRINYFENGSVIVDKNQLQNKKDRYYFKDTIELKKNQTYISKFDLNIENDKIEQPIKPMIRFSTPVYGNDGKLKGIVILNYYAKNILEQFKNTGATSYGNIYLVDSNGYWLYNSQNKDKEWGFMYEEKKDINFKNEFSIEWNKIINTEKGTFYTSNGHFSYINIIPNIERISDSEKVDKNSIALGGGNWVAVSFIPKSNYKNLMIFTDLYTNILYILKNHRVIFIFLFILSVIFAVIITINNTSKERVKYFSEYDSMTGMLNRRAGFELLNKIYRDYLKNKGNACVCFCDINGLKQVNDNLGHESGDELILTIATTIKKFIRNSDFVIRLGGDEFLIIFLNSDTKQAENIWNRIDSEFKKINELENRQYLISVSHGIEEFKFNTKEYIDEIINLADEKMYNEKRIIKKDFQVIRKI